LFDVFLAPAIRPLFCAVFAADSFSRRGFGKKSRILLVQFLFVLDFTAWCTEKPPVFFGFAAVGQSWFLIVCEFLEVKAETVLELFVQKTRVFLVLVVLL
jgi:hypothetical protein